MVSPIFFKAISIFFKSYFIRLSAAQCTTTSSNSWRASNILNKFDDSNDTIRNGSIAQQLGAVF